MEGSGLRFGVASDEPEASREVRWSARRKEQLVESLEFVIERARAAGRTEHLQKWQHDFAGAETAAVLEGQEEAAQALGRLYMETLEWLIGLVHERLQSPRRASTRARLPAPKQARPPVPVDPPALVTDLVGRPRERFGWPSLHRT